MGKNIEFDILARDRASATFDRVGKSSDGLGSKLGSVGKVGALALGGALVGGIAAVGAAMVRGVSDAASYQTLGAKTAAVLKSTGNVARQSVSGIQARAAALESLSGVDEELIINGQNVLATFTKVRDGVGKGNDIFNQATKASLNLSTALGTDMQSASIMVGKALNDPVKGLTAMSKAGIQFTADQKDQIKTMVKSGDTMGAQKVILKELETQFGGTAEAVGKGFNGSMARAKDAVGDAFRSIGEKLLPTVTKLADYVAKNAGPAIDTMSNAVSKVWGWISGRLWPALEKGRDTIMPGIKKALEIVTGGVGDSGMSWKKFSDILTEKVIPFVAKMISYYLPVLATNIRTAIEAVKLAWKTFEVWRDVIARVVSFIIARFGDMMSVWAAVLRGLSKVPGFGWAKDAAAKMQTAADKAHGVARAVAAIPNSKNVNVTISTKLLGPGRISVNGERVNVGMRAGGGPIRRGQPYLVGENGPELVEPRDDGMVIPSGLTSQIRAALAGGYSAGGSGGGDQPVVVQLMLDGRMIQQVLLKLKRQGGVELGLS